MNKILRNMWESWGLQPKGPLSNPAKEFQDFVGDLVQRNVLFWDVMRQRGNEMVEITASNSSTVLNFQFEKIMDGAEFAEPINYWLARIIPPVGVVTDNTKRPYVIQDPRAGQGPGIGGFKKDSEIGAALKNGHPVYFIGFNARPMPKQTYEDIIRGQINFYAKVAELHSDAPKMCAIGNCAAGYLTMFSAMQSPEIFGPILIAGSPISYWHGERGKNPMRYKGGLVGGSWLNSFLGDLGNGKFDGTYLVLGFDLLNQANFLWGKQYSLYANIDREGPRYLQFEKWWGDFIQFNTPEIKWLVDKLFIGNQLTTGQLTTADGIRLDPRLITSPLITFVSDGDNISPPPQSAGWIADLYADVAEIKARGQTIVYCLNHKVGHLAIFTATKIGKREDEMFVENMDTIDMLPPGLYELILETPEGAADGTKLSSRYEARSIEDIKKLGYNTEEEDRAFATVAKASAAFDFVYNTFVHPVLSPLVNQQSADIARALRPLRLGYTMFAEKYNPWMSLVGKWREQIAGQRQVVSADNKYWYGQQEWANYVNTWLSNWQDMQDKMQEQVFFNLWGNQALQHFWGTDQVKPRYTPSVTQLEREHLISEMAQKTAAYLPVKSKLEALFRIVALVQHDKHAMTERMAEAIKQQALAYAGDLARADLREIVKQQFMAVAHDYQEALAELKKYRMTGADRADMLELAHDIVVKFGMLDSDTQQILRKLAAELALLPAETDVSVS